MSDTVLPETVVTASRITDPSATGPQFEPFAGVLCSVEVYPFEGGRYAIQGGHEAQGGQIISCGVSKTRDGAAGTFSITLAPGGPYGTEGSPTWSEVITPMSLVLIGMQRGKVAAIVNIGIVRTVTESQVWITRRDGASVQRGQSIEGEDFSYYFLAQNYAAMTLFGITSGTVFGAATGLPPGLAFPASVSPGMIGGTQGAPSNPSQIAEQWYQLMVGTKGMMSESFVPYQPTGVRKRIQDIIKQIWEDYPASIPTSASFLNAEGSWMAKFQSILPFPMYEFFITTGPVGAYEESFMSGSIVASAGFTMASMPLAPAACPIVVGRVNPIPTLNSTATVSGGDVTLNTINVDRWSKLIVYQMGGAGFYSSRIGFSVDDAKNIYMINPISGVPLIGISNSNTTPVPFLFTMFGDPASIHRYGYRPFIINTSWWFDKLGIFAQNPVLGLAQGMADCVLSAVAQFHPTPMMARGTVTIPLRPDILPGNIFRYQPFKSPKPGNETWDFYIDSVQHNFAFGGAGQTTLNLSRGLPSRVYADTSAGGILESIWKGAARRVDGDYEVGLPEGTGPGLMAIESQNSSISNFLGKIGQAYVTPNQ